jgi:hypothetical protein
MIVCSVDKLICIVLNRYSEKRTWIRRIWCCIFSRKEIITSCELVLGDKIYTIGRERNT